MSNAFELVGQNPEGANIKVIGIGGGGSNAVHHMINEGIDGAQFVILNTDLQALSNSPATTKIQLGKTLTKGLGAGANPEVGRSSAEEDIEEIRAVLEGTDMVFITAGMGGGTGTGAAPVVAKLAKEMDILTVAVVTKPFSFERRARMAAAEQGIAELTQYVDSLITVPNEKLLKVLGRDVSLLNAFKTANNVLLGAVQGITELITGHGLINVDFADVRTVMSEMGMAMMGRGEASGETRAYDAAHAAIASPLLEDIDISDACGVLVNITGSPSMSLSEFDEVGKVIEGFTNENATVVMGTVIDEAMDNKLRITIVATGLGMRAHNIRQVLSRARQEGTPEPDYKRLEEQPTILRKREQTTRYRSEKEQTDMDYLDIPAFLRRRGEEMK